MEKRGRVWLTQNGPLKAAHVSIESSPDNSVARYFLGVSTGVGTLSITEDEPRMLLI
jgi:hypothetical protein